MLKISDKLQLKKTRIQMRRVTKISNFTLITPVKFSGQVLCERLSKCSS